MRPIPRYVALTVLLAMAGFAAVGFFSIRRDVDNLRVISQDNILWSASQLEIELLRFQLSVASLAVEKTDERLEEVHDRFDILWSRIFMMGKGHVGELMRGYDKGHNSLEVIRQYIEEVDPVLSQLRPEQGQQIQEILTELQGLQQEMRLYTLRVVRGDAAASASVRDRIQTSSQTTAMISLGSVLLSVFSLALILRENRRQKDLATMSRKSADEAEQSSRAKSRFLSMMSHELRNPLNGVIGPLTLLGQDNLGTGQKRLVSQAKNSSQSMLNMLSGLLDYGEIQDGRFTLKPEPFELTELSASVKRSLTGWSSSGLRVTLAPEAPAKVVGDCGRLSQVFVHLSEYVLEASGPEFVEVCFDHAADKLIGEVTLLAGGPALNWKLDILLGLNDVAPDQVSADSLRPLIAYGLISACGGELTLDDDENGNRVIKVTIPSEAVGVEHIRVHLETRSVALATIYRAALKSENVIFVSEDEKVSVDAVLVDSTSIEEIMLMNRLKTRYPDAKFVSLGTPECPEIFDEIVDTPNDMGRLRSSILGRLAS